MATVMGLVALAGCGSSVTTIDCTPACPARSHCTESGCVPDDGAAPPDFAVALDQKLDCPVPCSGATPYCGPSYTCVPCLQDSHCPPGSVCKVLGAGTACLPGCADDARCGGGSARCCGGACVDTSKDLANCGACGTTCLSNHASDSCQGGQCVIGACAAGWGDCNGAPKDGCEVNLRVDVANCGTCGTPCAPAHGTGACANVCYIAQCDYGWDDCNADPKDGCEVSTSADPRNCGACGQACAAVQHAQVGCQVGACQLTGCAAGFADCNGIYNDGCEVALATNSLHCGACGNACPKGLVCAAGQCTCPQCNIPNARTRCVNNVCVLDQCLPSWADCDRNANNGCEVSTDSDPKSCGGCGVVCPGNQICVAAACVAPAPAMAIWHLDENGGGNISDSSGHGHSGVTNGTSWVPGIAASGLSFPNAGSAQMQGPYLFSQTNALTIEGWLYLRRQTASYQGMVSGNGCCNYRLLVSPTMHPYYNPGERRDRSVNGFTFNIAQWYHFAMTIDGGVVNVYVDGNLVDSGPRDSGAALPDQKDFFQLGAGESPGLYVPDGIVDEVAIYDRALDQMTLRNHVQNPGKF